MLEVNAMGEVAAQPWRSSFGGREKISPSRSTLICSGLAELALADKPGGAVVALWRPDDGFDPGPGQSNPGLIRTFFSKLITTQKEYDALFSNPEQAAAVTGR